MPYQWRINWDDDEDAFNADSNKGLIPDKDILEWSLDWGTSLSPTASSFGLQPASGVLVLQGAQYGRSGDFGFPPIDSSLDYPHDAELRWLDPSDTRHVTTVVKRCRVVPVRRIPLDPAITLPSVWRIEARGQFALDHDVANSNLSGDAAFTIPATTNDRLVSLDDALQMISATSGLSVSRTPTTRIGGLTSINDEIVWAGSWAGLLNMLAGGYGGVAMEMADGSIQIWNAHDADRGLVSSGFIGISSAYGLDADRSRMVVQTDFLRTRFLSEVEDGSTVWRVLGDEQRYGARGVKIENLWRKTTGGRNPKPDTASQALAVAALVFRVLPRVCLELEFIEDFNQANVAKKAVVGARIDSPGGRAHVLRVRLRRDSAGVVTRRLTCLGGPIGTSPDAIPTLKTPVIRITGTTATSVTAAVDIPPDNGGNWYWMLFKGSVPVAGLSVTLDEAKMFRLPSSGAVPKTVLSADFIQPQGLDLLNGLDPNTDYTLAVSGLNVSPRVFVGEASTLKLTSYDFRAPFKTKLKSGSGDSIDFTIDSITADSARIVFSGPADTGVYWFRNGLLGYNFLTLNDNGVGTARLTHLTPETTYTVDAALTQAGLDDADDRVRKTFTTLAKPKPVTPPADVSVISIAVSGITQTQAKATFTSAGPADTWYYRWYRFGASPPTQPASWAAGATKDSLVVTLDQLTAGTTYVVDAADNTGFTNKVTATFTTDPRSVVPPPPPPDDRGIAMEATVITQTTTTVTMNSTGPAGKWFYRWYPTGTTPPSSPLSWTAQATADSLIIKLTSLTADTAYTFEAAEASTFAGKATLEWRTLKTVPDPTPPAATVLVSVHTITAVSASFTLTSETVGSRWFWQLLRGGKQQQSGSLSIPPSKSATKLLTGLPPSAGHTLNVSRSSSFPADDRKQVVFSTRTPNAKVTGQVRQRGATWTLTGIWPGVTWTWWVTRKGTLDVVDTGSFTTTTRAVRGVGGLTRAISVTLEPSSTYVLTYSWAGSVNLGAKTATLHTPAVAFTVSRAGEILRVSSTTDKGGVYYVRSRRMPAVTWTNEATLTIPGGGVASRSFGSRQPGVYEVQVSPRSDFGAAVKNITIQVS